MKYKPEDDCSPVTMPSNKLKELQAQLAEAEKLIEQALSCSKFVFTKTINGEILISFSDDFTKQAQAWLGRGK